MLVCYFTVLSMNDWSLLRLGGGPFVGGSVGGELEPPAHAYGGVSGGWRVVSRDCLETPVAAARGGASDEWRPISGGSHAPCILPMHCLWYYPFIVQCTKWTLLTKWTGIQYFVFFMFYIFCKERIVSFLIGFFLALIPIDLYISPELICLPNTPVRAVCFLHPDGLPITICSTKMCKLNYLKLA